MMMWKRLWQDDAGFVVSAELVLVGTILVLGVVVGLNAVRNSVTNELADVAAAIDSTNQSYNYSSLVGHAALTLGSEFADTPDYCDEGNDSGTAQCIDQFVDTIAEGGNLQFENP